MARNVLRLERIVDRTSDTAREFVRQLLVDIASLLEIRALSSFETRMLIICKPTGLVLMPPHSFGKMTEMSSSIDPGYATRGYSPHLNLYDE
jgi:hypothetical protein